MADNLSWSSGSGFSIAAMQSGIGGGESAYFQRVIVQTGLVNVQGQVTAVGTLTAQVQNVVTAEARGFVTAQLTGGWPVGVTGQVTAHGTITAEAKGTVTAQVQNVVTAESRGFVTAQVSGGWPIGVTGQVTAHGTVTAEAKGTLTAAVSNVVTAQVAGGTATVGGTVTAEAKGTVTAEVKGTLTANVSQLPTAATGYPVTLGTKLDTANDSIVVHGASAFDSPIGGNPVPAGLYALTGQPGAVAHGDVAYAVGDKYGRQIVRQRPFVADWLGTACPAITGITGINVFAAQGTGTGICVTQVTISNADGLTGALVSLLNGAQAVHQVWCAPSGGGAVIGLHGNPLMISANSAFGVSIDASGKVYVAAVGYREVY